METGKTSSPEELQNVDRKAQSTMLIAMFAIAAFVFVVGMIIIAAVLLVD